jgi:hypothetical protein
VVACSAYMDSLHHETPLTEMKTNHGWVLVFLGNLPTGSTRTISRDANCRNLVADAMRVIPNRNTGIRIRVHRAANGERNSIHPAG